MQATAVRATPYYTWIVNPWIDLLFICGGLVWICTLLHMAIERVWNIPLGFIIPGLQIFLMYIFNNAHTVSTWVRIGHSPESRREFRWYLVIGVAALALAIRAMGDFQLAGAMMKLYMLWVVQHYAAQAYGLALVYLYKTGYPTTVVFKRILKSTFFLIAAVAILLQMTYQPLSINFFILPLPFWGPLPEWMFKLAVIALCVCCGLLAGQVAWNYHTRGVLPPLASFLLFGSTLVFLLQSGHFSQVLWLYAPPFFHGSQYVILSGTFHLRETGTAEQFDRVQAWKAWFTYKGLVYCGLVIAGGALLYEFSPWFLAQFGFDQAVALGAVFAAANFHHFLTDRAIWKLRDPKVRKLTLA